VQQMMTSETPSSETMEKSALNASHKVDSGIEDCGSIGGMSRYCGVIWLRLHTTHASLEVERTGPMGENTVHCILYNICMVTTRVP
jgi:hypothetical protein